MPFYIDTQTLSELSTLELRRLYATLNAELEAGICDADECAAIQSLLTRIAGLIAQRRYAPALTPR